MFLLTLSAILIVIAAYAIYRHFKTRRTSSLDAKRRNKKH